MYQPLWRCKDGRVLRLREMETDHIKNSIRMIECSKRGWRVRYLAALKLELDIRRLGHG
jgi:hypothetical protein